MTTGILLQLLINKKNLNEYTHIIVDEVHERDLETDLLLLVIKKIMIDRHDLKIKIILMSATLNADKFLKYFPNFMNVGESVIKVTQPSAFKVKEIYLEQLANQFVRQEEKLLLF
jgi:ATP-dependent RNA helicase TDRD9